MNRPSPRSHLQESGSGANLPAPVSVPTGRAFLRNDHRVSRGFALLIGIVFVSLCAWSWRKWPDIQVDFSLQLYAPWQLASGKVLFRDVAYLSGGPLSQYFHALLFRCFGVSFLTLIITNLCLLALFIHVLYRLFARAADAFTAASVCLVTLCAFSFSQYVPIGNYNYVCPYVYDAFHGLVLSVVAIGCLCRWIASGQHSLAGALGLCAGAVFLTKPELFMALAGALVAGGMVGCARRKPAREVYGLFLLGLVMPAVVFLVYFSIVWQFREGIRAVLWAWVPLLTTSIAQSPFFQSHLGLDEPAANLVFMFQYSAGFILAIALMALFSRCWQRRNFGAGSGLGLALIYLLFLSITRFRWVHCGRVFLIATLIGSAFVARRWWKTRHTPESDAFVLPLVWSVFALLLLSKMGLKPQIWHYGFYLGMPAAVFVVFLVIRLLPLELERFQVNPLVFRALATMFLVGGLVQLLGESNRFYQTKDFPVGQGGDLIIVRNPKVAVNGYALQSTVSWIQENLSPSNTLAAVPEGVLINYLTRRPNPTPYTIFTPSELEVYGETNMVNAFAKNSPDYIVLVHRDSAEWKLNYFGKEPGNGYDLMQWIQTHYSPVWLLGHEPLQSNWYGIKLLKRNNL